MRSPENRPFHYAKSSSDQNSEYFPITCHSIASPARSQVSHFEHRFERVFFIFCLILFLTQLEIENVALLAQLIGCRRSGRFIFKIIQFLFIDKVAEFKKNINLDTLQVVTGRSDKLLLLRVNLMQLESRSVVEAKK